MRHPKQPRCGTWWLVGDRAHQFLSEVRHSLLINMNSVPGLEVDEKPKSIAVVSVTGHMRFHHCLYRCRTENARLDESRVFQHVFKDLFVFIFQQIRERRGESLFRLGQQLLWQVSCSEFALQISVLTFVYQLQVK